MEIHIARDGKQFGPFPLEEVQRQLANGKLFPGDLAWTQGATNWVPLASFPPLQSIQYSPQEPPVSPLRALNPTKPVAGVVRLQQPPQTSGAAIASLILGIVSLIFLPFFASLPAVICGHIARGNIRRSGGTLNGDGMAIAGLIMGYLWLALLPFIAVVAILAGIALPVFGEVQLRGNETKALSNAKQIGTACQLYAMDHGDAFPPKLDNLIPNYLPDRKLFVSPLSPGESMAYDYFGGTQKDRPDKVLLLSKFKDRHGKRIIIHADGSGLIGIPPPEVH